MGTWKTFESSLYYPDSDITDKYKIGWRLIGDEKDEVVEPLIYVFHYFLK